jgi:2-dehydropantoate 2-reductase
VKIAIMGSGAVGGYFGARLAQAGEDVTFIARGRQLVAMRQSGLKVESARGDVHLLPIRAVRDPASVGFVDLVLFTVKLWSTEEAGHQLAPLIGPDTMVLSLQNGVDANRILARLVGRERLLGGVSYISALVDRPGVIQHSGQMARRVFFRSPSSPKTRRAIWEKFIFLVGLSAMTTLTRRSIGAVRSDADTRGMLLDVLREAAAVGRAKGVHLDVGEAEKQLAFVDTLPAGLTSSMYRDLERGNMLEVGWLSGAVVRLGRESGIETPANRAVYTALKLHADASPRAA